MQVETKKTAIFTRQELFSIIDNVLELNDNERVVDITHLVHNGTASVGFVVAEQEPAPKEPQS